MNRKLVFLDIDGTLIDKGETLYPSVIEAISKAKKNGHKLFICTGREKCFVSPKLFEIGLNDGVFSAGANVVCDDKSVYHTSFSAEDCRKIVEILVSHKSMTVLEAVSMVTILKNTYRKSADFFYKWLESLGAKSSETMSENPDAIDKIVYFDSDCSLDELAAQLNDICVVVPMSYENNNNSGEIMQMGVTKATGIQRVLDYYGASVEDTIGIGDSSNDIEMLGFCKLGICMGNGTAQAKQAADYITEDIDKDGLYKAFVKAGLI